MIDVRTESATVHHRGVGLVATTTTAVLKTRWAVVAASYRRPSRVVAGDGTSIPIRDHSMILRCGAVAAAALLLMKGMTR